MALVDNDVIRSVSGLHVADVNAAFPVEAIVFTKINVFYCCANRLRATPIHRGGRLVLSESDASWPWWMDAAQYKALIDTLSTRMPNTSGRSGPRLHARVYL